MIGTSSGSALARRVLLALAGLAAGVMAGDARASDHDAAPALSSDQALVRLQEGAERFVSGKIRHPHTGREWRDSLGSAQHPFAMILGCADSRVPPELIFDQGFGDLFVVRVAGNVIASDVLGSMQYARYHLHVPLAVVLGHEGCGAVSAAVAAKAGQHGEPAAIQALVSMISPGLGELDAKAPPAQQISSAVEANVRWSMKQLTALPGVRKLLDEGKVALVGAVYDVQTGKVRWLK